MIVPPNEELSIAQQIVDHFKQGYTPDVIARILIVSYGLVTSVLTDSGCLPTEQERVERDRNLTITLSNAGFTSDEIAWKLDVDREFVIRIIEAKGQQTAVDTTDSHHLNTWVDYGPWSDNTTNARNKIPKAIKSSSGKPKPKPRRKDILLGKRIYKELLKSKVISVIARECSIFQHNVPVLLNYIGIGKAEIKKIKQLARCRDIVVSKHLLSIGYTALEIAAHFGMPELTINYYLKVPVSRLIYHNERSLIQGFVELESFISHTLCEDKDKCKNKNQVSKRHIPHFLKGSGEKLSLKSKMGNKKTDPQKIETIANRIITEIEAKKKLKDISLLFNISIYQIHRYLKTAGTDVKTLRQSILDKQLLTRSEEIKHFKQLWESGKNWREVVNITGYSMRKISQLQKEACIFNSPKIKERIKTLYLEGRTVQQIAEHLYCNTSTIYNILGSKLIQRTIKQERKQKAKGYKQLLKEGKSLNEIADIHKGNISTIRYYLEKYGNVYLPSYNKSKAGEVRKALLAGWSTETIIRKGIASWSTVYLCKRKLGL